MARNQTNSAAPLAALPENLAWDALLELPDDRTAPLHVRLTRALREAIQAGRIPAGSALPPTRALAETLGCSRWTVTEAYEQLAAEGYVAGRTGSATRVRWHDEASAPPRAPERVDREAAAIDLAPGLPDLRVFPRERWLAALRAVAASTPFTKLGYPESGGEWRLREVLAAYLARVRGASASADDVTICSGVTDAVTRACRALRAAGTRFVGVEDPGWTKLRQAIESAGLEYVPIAVDDGGFCVEWLAEYPQVAAVIVSPAHQFPTGTVLAPDRRAALLDWASRGDRLILEDDYDAEFRYDRRPVGTLQGGDPRRVALLGSVSKTLSPALGIGWIATPPAWTPRIRATEIRVAEPPVLDQLAFASFLEAGSYDRHLRLVRKRYRARRDRLVKALERFIPGATVAGAAAGLHLLLHIPDPPDPRAVLARARELGVSVAIAEAYRVKNRNLGGALVLGYGNLDDGDVERGAEILCRAISEVRLGKPGRAGTRAAPYPR